MSNPIGEQLRASDFVIFKGEALDKKTNQMRPYEFAKIDNRCSLMNNEAFLAELKAQGARVITK